jgi:hypothetical protein
MARIVADRLSAPEVFFMPIAQRIFYRMIKQGDPIPSFALPSDIAGVISDKNLLGKRWVLFIYPKDDTFG